MTSIHDLNFKEIMSHRDVFVDACRAYLPKGLVKRVDWDSVQLVRLEGAGVGQSSSDGPLKQGYADVVYEFLYDQAKPGLFITHFEHQTKPDKLMPLRFATYNCHTLMTLAKTRKLTGDLPVVIGLLYYQGKITPYPYSLDLLDLFTDKPLAAKHLFKPQLIDVGQLSDEEIAKHGQFAPAEALFKELVRGGINKRAIRGFVEQAKVSYNMKNGLPRVFFSLVRYALEASDLDQATIINEVIKAFPEQASDIMTAAEQLRQMGREEGREEGREAGVRDVAIRLLEANTDVQLVKKVTQLPMSEIKILVGDLNKKRKD